jgi:4-hydroxy-tetrahydrodipicolinate synthase
MRAAQRGDWVEARRIYRWFMPLLHLDVAIKLVQYIKLANQIAGEGKEWVRPPRLPLVGEERKKIEDLVNHAIATRPKFAKAA